MCHLSPWPQLQESHLRHSLRWVKFHPGHQGNLQAHLLWMKFRPGQLKNLLDHIYIHYHLLLYINHHHHHLDAYHV